MEMHQKTAYDELSVCTVQAQKRKMGEQLYSPFFPLLLIALHVWSDLLGEPLVLSQLGLCITCSSLCETERIFSD